MVTVSIHQPNYLPYIGYFQKMARSDIFVLLDTVQFSNDSYTQRTRIRTPEGWMWLTIPVNKKYKFHQIKEIFLPDDITWKKKHKLSLISHYSKTPFFDDSFITDYYSGNNSFDTLQDFNEFGIFYLVKKFNIKTKILRASELGIDENLKSTDLIVKIVKKVNGTTYFSGSGGTKYLDERKFSENHLDLKFFNFNLFTYPQRWENFEPYMSAVDFYYNCGSQNLDRERSG